MIKNYAVFPCKDVRITQSYDGQYSHWTQSASKNGVKSYPIDICYGDTYLMAPCKMKSVKMNAFNDDAGANIVNQIFFQSVDKVLCADGTEDYITILATHPDDWDYTPGQIGTVYERGQNMVNQGTDGGVAAHLDIVVAKGLQSGWVKNSYGEWVLPNSYKPEEIFFIDHKFNNVIDTCGLQFKTIPADAYIILPGIAKRDINVNQFEVLYSDVNVRSGAGKENPVVIFPCIEGIYNVIEEKNGWYKIKEGMWINQLGGTYYPKYVAPVIEEPDPEPVKEGPIENEPETPQEEEKPEEGANTSNDTETPQEEDNSTEIDIRNTDKINVLVEFFIWLFKKIGSFIYNKK